jgi:hypothetical protein
MLWMWGHAAVVEAAAVDAPRQTGGQGLDLWNRTYYPKLLDTKKEEKPWYVVDAEGQTLGRLATCVANHIRCEFLRPFTWTRSVRERSLWPSHWHIFPGGIPQAFIWRLSLSGVPL